MSPTIEDVRHYIAIKPVPVWKEAIDSKLKARSLLNYTLERPTREEVFKSNYARRMNQMSIQGYCSPAWKPYQEVGKPLYLSSKHMLQSSLGQNSTEFETNKENAKNSTDISNEADDNTKQRSGDSEKKDVSSKSSEKSSSNKAVSIKNKQNRNLQNIERDLTTVRENLVKVKMGHALFPMLEEEHHNRNTAFLVERQNEIRRLKNGMHIQQVTSEESDEAKLHSTSSHSLTSKQTLGRRASSRASVISSSPVPAMTANKPEAKKTLAERARPFTPVHSNISLPVESESVHTSIWRQLCALHWLLEACKLEAKSDSQHLHKVMIPLSECWNELHPGGRTRDSRIILQERKNNTKWTKFTRVPHHKHPARSRTRRKNTGYSFHSLGMRRNVSIASEMGNLRKNASIASDLGSLRRQSSVINDNEFAATGQRPLSARSNAINIEVGMSGIEDFPGVKASRPSSPGQSSITTTVAWGTVPESECGDDESVMDVGLVMHESDKRKDNDEWFHEKDHHEHLKKLLSTVKESVSNEMQRRARTALYVAQENNRLPLSVYEWSRNSYFKIGKKEINISKIVVPASTPVTDYSEPKKIKTTPSAPKIRPHTAVVSRRRESSIVAVNESTTRPPTAAPGTKTKIARPKSSPAKLVSHFNFKFSSEEKKENLGQLKEQFDQVNDTKALQLHNKLTELEKVRKKRMEVKFKTLDQTSSVHRGLQGMRTEAHAELIAEKKSKKKHSCMLPCEWYNTLIHNLPGDVHSDENCNLILEKLGVMGIQMMEDFRRISPEYFLNVLKTLRPWELCSPDVSSAIEFMREYVVQMDAKELDEWRGSRINPKEVITGSDRK